MSPSTRTVFTGDSKDLEAAALSARRSVKSVETAAGTTDKHLQRLGDGSEKAKRKIVGFGNAANLALGAAGLGLGIASTISAFKELEKVNSTTSAGLRTFGLDTTAVHKRVDAATLALEKLSGFTDKDLKGAFGTLVLSTGDVEKALQGTALAADIARARGQDLGSVTRSLAKVFDGNVGAARRLGVAVEKGATVQEALAAAQKRYSGQAKAYGDTTSGAADKANASFERLQANIGRAFVPALNAASTGLLDLSTGVQAAAEHVGGLGTVVAGAAGFGALQLAAPVVGKFGGIIENLGANVAASGGGFRGFGRAVAGSIGPMGIASVGAGVLAAGIYTIWQNSESATQAAQGLNRELTNLAGAQDQSRVATENLKLANIGARKADEALAAQKKANRGLHNQVVNDNRAEARAVREASAAKKEHGTNSKEYNNAYRDAASAISKADGTQKAYTKGLKASGDLATYASIAHSRLDAAQKAVDISAGGVADQQEKVDRKLRDVIDKSRRLAQLGRRDPTQLNAFTSPGSGQQLASNLGGSRAAAEAKAFARLLNDAADGLDRTQVAARRTDRAVAFLATRLGRFPSTKEVKVVQKYVAQGLTLDQIKAKLDNITSKVVTVTTRANARPFSSHIDPITGLAVPGASTGARVAGAYNGSDSVNVNVGPGERILNPGQVALVDAGMSVDEALAATNAPLIGPGSRHQGGGVPIKTRLSQKGLTPPGRVPPKAKAAKSGGNSGPTDRRPAWLKRFEDSGKLDGQDAYENARARAEADLADAGRTSAKSDDIRATHRLLRLSNRWLGQLHGPIRGAHREAVWQRAVNEAITSTAGSISGYRSGLTDLVRRPGPDDVEVNLPSGKRWAIERAGYTESPADDISALNAKAQWLTDRLNARDHKGRYLLPLKSAKRIAYSRELARTNLELASLGASQKKQTADDAAQALADAGVAPELPIGVQEALADAALTPDTADDFAALDLERVTLERQIAEATDPRVRVALKGNLAGVLGSIASLKDATSGGGAAGPTADESAIATQGAARLAAATRQASISEAELAGLRGSGRDVGTGQYASVLQAGGSGAAILVTLGDQRSLAAIAGAAVAGMGAQASTPANREQVGIR